MVSLHTNGSFSQKNEYASILESVQSLLPLTNECGVVISMLAVEIESVHQFVQLGLCSSIACSRKLLAQDAHLLMGLHTLDELLEAH